MTRVGDLAERTSKPFPLARILFSLLSLGFLLLTLVPTSVWQAVLIRGSGETAAKMLPHVRAAMGLATVLFSAIAIACFVANRSLNSMHIKALNRLIDDSSDREQVDDNKWRRRLCWLIVCFGLVLLFDGPSLFFGYFESDDFDFLIANRHLHWTELPFANLNDHVFPLVRFEIRGMYSLFGGFAPAYSALAMASLASMMAMGCWMLLELRFTKLSILTFCASCIGWTMWGQFTSGEYILLAYQPLMTFAIGSAWAVLRYQREPHRRFLWVLCLCTLVACFSNISGFWVACSSGVFLAWGFLMDIHSMSFGKTAGKWSWATASVVIPTALALAFCFYAYSRPESTGFLSASSGERNLGSVATQSAYVISSAILSFLIPLPHHLIDFGLLHAAVILSLFAMFVSLAFVWRKQSFAKSLFLVGVVLVMLGIALMISLGRPTEGLGQYVPPKYLFLEYVWVCVFIAFVVEAGFRNQTAGRRELMGKVLFLALAASWAIHAVAGGLGAAGVPFFEITRGGEWREHLAERSAYKQMESEIFGVLESRVSGPIHMLDLPGHIVCSRFPALRYPWGHEPQLSIPLDVLAKRPERFRFYSHSDLPYPVEHAEMPLRQVVSPAFLDLIKNDESFRRLYLAPYRLTSTAYTGETPKESYGQAVRDALVRLGADREGNLALEHGTAADFLISDEEWAPEEMPYLLIAATGASAEMLEASSLRFRSDVAESPLEYGLPANCLDGNPHLIHLREIPGYELSESISDFTVRLSGPGKVRLAYLLLLRELPQTQP